MSDKEFRLPHYTKLHHTETYASISPSRPELSTKGKAVVITGAGTGVGAATALAYAESGAANLALVGRTEKTLLATKAALESFSTTINSKLDILVANASYLPDLTPVLKSKADDWWKGFEINVKGQYNLVQAFSALAVDNAILINISSCVAHLPFAPGHGSYHASKIAAFKLFDYIQIENPDLIVMHFHPGVIDTDMARKSYAAGTPKMQGSNGGHFPSSQNFYSQTTVLTAATSQSPCLVCCVVRKPRGAIPKRQVPLGQLGC
jgi:NAD(P)-dependent dehydrogenase (short-subunit alcohol dehydrogenase family)